MKKSIKKDITKSHLNLKFLTLVLVISFILIQIFNHFFGIIRIVGPSMYPTYSNGELHLYSTDTTKIERGNVVIFKNKNQTENQLYIKRVVAISGDTFACKGTTYYLNGNLLNEKYINKKISDVYNFTTYVPQGYVFVCGDNRDKSTDSRSFGVVNVKDIVGIIKR